jgi:ribosomal protein L16/L10AE
MAIRRAKAYSKRHVTTFTRKSKSVKHLNYIKVVPNQKVTKFNMGNVSKFNKQGYKYFITMTSTINIIVRDMALEAARQFLNNNLTKLLVNDYYLACKPYPHQVLRDNKTFSGGSKGERVQSGMAHSFGSSMGRAAYVKAETPIFIVGFPEKKHTEKIRELFRSVSSKIPCKTKITYSEVA